VTIINAAALYDETTNSNPN